MPAVAPVPVSTLPQGPSTDRPATFDSEADALIAALPVTVDEINDIADVTYQNAVFAEGQATAAGESAQAAQDYAGSASNSAAAAVAAAQTAVSAPGTSATSTTSLTVGTGNKSLGIQAGKSIVVGMSLKIAMTATPTTWMHGTVTAYNASTGALDVTVTLTSGSGSATAWTVSLSGPAGQAATGTTLADYGITDAQPKYDALTDKGTVSSGTVTFDVSVSEYQRVQAGGNITLALTGWPASGKLAELLLELVNFGGKTITLPTVNWVKTDGATTTTFSSLGITFQTTGTDWVLLWSRDGGTTIYGKVMR